jgi:malate dehydrogenase
LRKFHAKTRKSSVARNRRPESPATLRSAAAVELTEAYPACAAYLQGEYGLSDLFVSVPVKPGSGGIEEVIEPDLSDDERSQLEESANHVRKMVESLYS